MTITECIGFALCGFALGVFCALRGLRRRARMERYGRTARRLLDGGTVRRA